MTTATLTRPAADKKTTKTAAPVKSVLNESRQIERAAMLIQMGARMQVLESETTLSYERLIRLYKEIAGKSPSKGQLPFSTDWFLTWQENIHSSLFLNIYEYLAKGMDLDPGGAAALVHARLAPGEVRGCRHAPAHQMRAVRRHVRDRAVRKPPLHLRPVQPAGPRRQEQERRRADAALRAKKACSAC